MAALPTGARAVIGCTWRERMRQEHLAVGAFSLLVQELAREGCPPVLLSLVTRAANDEVRHAEVRRQVAIAFLCVSRPGAPRVACASSSKLRRNFGAPPHRRTPRPYVPRPKWDRLHGGQEPRNTESLLHRAERLSSAYPREHPNWKR